MAKKKAASGNQELVAARAQAIWEREGRPEGRSEIHWQLAEQEIAAETKSAQKPKAPKPKPARQAKAVPAAVAEEAPKKSRKSAVPKSMDRKKKPAAISDKKAIKLSGPKGKTPAKVTVPVTVVAPPPVETAAPTEIETGFQEENKPLWTPYSKRLLGWRTKSTPVWTPADIEEAAREQAAKGPDPVYLTEYWDKPSQTKKSWRVSAPKSGDMPVPAGKKPGRSPAKGR